MTVTVEMVPRRIEIIEMERAELELREGRSFLKGAMYGIGCAVLIMLLAIWAWGPHG